MNTDDVEEPSPVPDAVLIEVWRIRASSFAVAPPSPYAVLIFPYLKDISEPDCPAAEPVLKTVRNSFDVEEPLPLSETVLRNVVFSSEFSEPAPFALAVLRLE